MFYPGMRPVTAAVILIAPALAVPTQSPPDTDIANVVDRELTFDGAVAANMIDVSTADGIVTLTGTVDNLLAKERAARIAETVKGVRSVVNRIRVHAPESDPGETIATRVKRALLVDPATDSYEVTVEVVPDGHVVLSGAVDSWKERELAAHVAKGVSGVVALTNQITVDPETERPDAEIAAEIREALRWNALVDDGLIEVAVTDGEVALTGIVGSAAEKREARRTAWTAGVRSIDDSALDVERWARDDDLRKSKYVVRSEDEIRRAIEDALMHDPRVSSFNVAPSVRDNAVTLRGVVDNLRARRAAEQVAHDTVGVGLVYNYLKVRPAQERSAQAIAEDVRAALRRDPYVDRYEITVDVEDGTVYLSGSVDSYFEKAQADDLAARVNGVTDVVNSLEAGGSAYGYDPYVDDWLIYGFDWYDYVPSYTYELDQNIRRAIEEELAWSPFVDADEVSVSVNDGIATLTGEVDSWMEKGAARDNAYQAGATYVRNDLIVSAPGTMEASATRDADGVK